MWIKMTFQSLDLKLETHNYEWWIIYNDFKLISHSENFACCVLSTVCCILLLKFINDKNLANFSGFWLPAVRLFWLKWESWMNNYSGGGGDRMMRGCDTFTFTLYHLSNIIYKVYLHNTVQSTNPSTQIANSLVPFWV